MKSLVEQISWYLERYGVPIVLAIMGILLILNNYVWS
tara:strand:- start:465 stop:575 length:111 start_codon:yes stop_codon:yes gene_type:complete